MSRQDTMSEASVPSSDMNNAAQEELLKIIKYLRQEKNLASTKCEVVSAEATRLKGQLTVLQKQLEEKTAALAKISENTQAKESASAKHHALLLKVGTFLWSRYLIGTNGQIAYFHEKISRWSH